MTVRFNEAKSVLYRHTYIMYKYAYKTCMYCVSVVALYISRCCGGSGGDILPGLRGCGCGGGVCYCVQSKHSLSH